ncbi:MAG: arginine--tRNA ligase [Candidatus Harrisonbacteria bacterium]|nr:arginine--tRNA ligase [Candidatus Harrisonbacteria bacterium]
MNQYSLEKILAQITKVTGITPIFPPAEIHADLALPCFKTDPESIKNILKKKKIKEIESLIISGRYVNITFNPLLVAKNLFSDLKKSGKNFGARKKSNKKIFLEYSSPNIAKPLHIGHLRNTLLGRALHNLFLSQGYKVTTENWLGDWGKQYGLVILAYTLWGDDKAFAKSPTTHLFDLYVKINEAAKTDPTIHDKAREIFKKMEDGDKHYLALWKKFREASIKDFKKSYKKLNIIFDFWHGESFYTPYMEAVIKSLLKKKIASHTPNGPTVIDLTDFNLNSYLVKKADGASLYSARDLATQIYRYKKYKPEKIFIITAEEQGFYFKQLIKTLGLLGYPENRFKNIVYGIVNLAGGKMSTRSGNIVGFDELLDEAENRAGKTIGHGAVIYNLLSQTNEKTVNFDLDRALSLVGNSAPYIQYASVRIQNILKKAKKPSPLKDWKNISLTQLEKDLSLLLSRYPLVVKQSTDDTSPHLLISYLQSLATVMSRYYTETSILKTPEKHLLAFRLKLLSAINHTLISGLSLLGISVPKKM